MRIGCECYGANMFQTHTYMYCDLLSYFIKDGQVSESGTHDQLLDQRGDYYEYVQLQALSKK